MSQFLSIIIPVFNSSKFIEKCLISICSQLTKNTELILVDDCSTDQSLKILQKYSKLFKFIKLIKLKKNSGAANSRNVGIKASSGEYICFLDSDDKLIPRSIANILFNLKKYPQKDIYVLRNKITGITTTKNILEMNSIKNIKPEPLSTLAIKPDLLDYSLNKVVKEKSIIHYIENFSNFRPTCWNFLFKSKFLKSNSIFFNSNIRISEDWPFTSKALCLSKNFKVIEKPTYLYQRLVVRTLGTTTGYIWVISNLKIINEINNFIKKKKKRLRAKKIEFLIELIKRANYFVHTDIMICSDKDINKISKYIEKINTIIPDLSNLKFKKLNQYYKKNSSQIFLKLKGYKLKKNMIIKKKLSPFFDKKIILFCAGRSGYIASKILINQNFMPFMFVDNNRNFSNSYINGIRVYDFKYIRDNFDKIKKSKIIICDHKIQIINNISAQIQKIGFRKRDIMSFDML